MEKNYLTIGKISSYQKSFDLSNEIWEVVIKWDYFAKDTVGKQFVRSADSISANIAEGFGRYSKKDKVKFHRISLASLEESCDWLRKSKARDLISENEKSVMNEKFADIKKEIYHLIKFTNEKLKF
ncbi:MAG TPA: four helix bundle protein [Draconibacterium sp.]|nr:four helix bundle protein [Draconibacterium sp.]